jgi:hypothetical protein
MRGLWFHAQDRTGPVTIQPRSSDASPSIILLYRAASSASRWRSRCLGRVHFHCHDLSSRFPWSRPLTAMGHSPCNHVCRASLAILARILSLSSSPHAQNPLILLVAPPATNATTYIHRDSTIQGSGWLNRMYEGYSQSFSSYPIFELGANHAS